MIGEDHGVHTVGALSLDGISKFIPSEKKIFYSNYNIPPYDFALVTFHPETISPELNQSHAYEMREALEQLSSSLYLIITMPNADTMGSIFRKEIEKIKREFKTLWSSDINEFINRHLSPDLINISMFTK